MTIEYREGDNGAVYTVTTACPFCNGDIETNAGLAVHLEYHCGEVEG